MTKQELRSIKHQLEIAKKYVEYLEDWNTKYTTKRDLKYHLDKIIENEKLMQEYYSK